NTNQPGDNRGGNRRSNSLPESVKSDVFNTLAPIYHMSKICGLLPVKFKKDKTGRYRGRLSLPATFYGIFLMLGLVGIQIWGLYRDLRDGWRNSTRLSSETGITSTCSDVYAVISVVVISIIGSPYRWKDLNNALNKIVEVDEKLNTPTSKNLRHVSIIVISSSLIYVIVLSILDFISWTLATETKDNKNFGDKGPINYVPISFMYIVIITFELQYALVLFNVGERFLKLNKTIENLTRTNLVIKYFRQDLRLDMPSNSQKNSTRPIQISDLPCPRLRRRSKISDFANTEEGTWGASDPIDQLIILHGILCDSIISINKAYGGAILISTISCLIHLIITPYFLYNQIYSDNGNGWYVIAIQIFWTLFHIYRLLLFVQPCHMVATKARRTGSLISQALASNWDPEAKKRLEIFSLQLLQRPVRFTACGLFSLDRGLVTS
ncbi:hypothetical protein QAD02_009730, partial [Eretmocerus hayati]